MYSIIESTINKILVPIRVFKDKIYNVINKDSNNNMKKIERIFPKNNITEYYTFFGPPTEIFPRIFLGSAYNAASYDILISNNIKFIINVTDEITNYYPDHFVYYNIKIADNNNDSIYQYLEESFKLINDFLELNDGNILIHCFMGASRSASIAANYISKQTNTDITDVINDMKYKRDVVNPTQQFFTDLHEIS
jgi:hypothetical protein